MGFEIASVLVFEHKFQISGAAGRICASMYFE